MSNEYKQTLARFEQAVREHEMKGAAHPDRWDEIEEEYEAARAAIVGKLVYRTTKRAVVDQGVVHWAVCKVDERGLSVVYGSLYESANRAYHAAGPLLGDPPYNQKTMNHYGWRARRVRITLEV